MKVSVIIPTYNRIDTLKKVIDALKNQLFPAEDYEVIVVDDGSIDGTAKEGVTIFGDAVFSSRYLRQENKGPAAARNKAILQSKGEVLLIIGDDIIPSESFINVHWQAHEKAQGNIVVIGKTLWHPDLKISPFMKCLEMGIQFDFTALENKEPDFRYAYTSNISLKRSFMVENKIYFDENMPYAAFEDIEWGFRLQQKGAKFCYQKNALAYHYHPVSFSMYKKRMYASGRALYHLNSKCPEIGFTPREKKPLKRACNNFKAKMREFIMLSSLFTGILVNLFGISRYRWIRSVLSYYEEKGYFFEKNRS